MVGAAPKPKPQPTAAVQRRRTAAEVPAAPPPSSRSRPYARPTHPEPRRRTLPHVEIPDVEAEVRRNTDVCALGRKYGGWRGDSPEAVICEQAYGR
ncbi:hypothetical protein SAMN04487983_100258 [Streptomyces sp. yr375]|nr:hypothetical protein SAMN04487983_100258 [Streptomyces sp. yr375]